MQQQTKRYYNTKQKPGLVTLYDVFALKYYWAHS